MQPPSMRTPPVGVGATPVLLPPMVPPPVAPPELPPPLDVPAPDVPALAEPALAEPALAVDVTLVAHLPETHECEQQSELAEHDARVAAQVPPPLLLEGCTDDEQAAARAAESAAAASLMRVSFRAIAGQDTTGARDRPPLDVDGSTFKANPGPVRGASGASPRPFAAAVRRSSRRRA